MIQIEVKNLVAGYEKKKVLDGVSFKVHKGDYLCIVGDNGSGKTTLVKCLTNIIKPFSGEIIFGDNIKKTEIGYLPQQTEIQKDFPASVKEIVISGCLAHMGHKLFYTSHEKEHAKDNMTKLGIWDLRNRCYRELSGGQQQRVLLARALCATEKLLILDEPVAGLDPKATEEMYAIIKKLNDEGTTIIMVTHDIKCSLENATHILHIGNEFFCGTKKDFLAKRGEK